MHINWFICFNNFFNSSEFYAFIIKKFVRWRHTRDIENSIKFNCNKKIFKLKLKWNQNECNSMWFRRHLLKKRMSKGPYKIILTATDFVFPQIPDARRVSYFFIIHFLWFTLKWNTLNQNSARRHCRALKKTDLKIFSFYFAF